MYDMDRFYWFARAVVQWVAVLVFRARFHHVNYVPRRGGVLVVSNHQSFMDPMLAGMALPRDTFYMARDSLFKNRWFAKLMFAVHSFPVKRNTADLGAIKETLRLLKNGKVVVMFPEGTRTEDGHIGPMLPGLSAIVKKAKVPVVPVLIDGMFQAWPKNRIVPHIGDVIVDYGPPISADECATMSPEQLVDEIRTRLLAIQQEWHGRVPRRRLEWFTPQVEQGAG